MVRDKGIYDKTCEVCGSQYKITHVQFPAKDSHPKIACQICGHVFIPARSNTTDDYNLCLIKKAEWPKSEGEQ